GTSARTCFEAWIQWAIVTTGAWSASNVMSDCGLRPAGFSDTGAALLVKTFSRTKSTAFELVRPQAIRSRIVRRRSGASTMPGTRSGTIRSPAELDPLVTTFFTSSVNLALDGRATQAWNSSFEVNCSPMLCGP